MLTRKTGGLRVGKADRLQTEELWCAQSEVELRSAGAEPGCGLAPRQVWSQGKA